MEAIGAGREDSHLRQHSSVVCKHTASNSRGRGRVQTRGRDGATHGSDLRCDEPREAQFQEDTRERSHLKAYTRAHAFKCTNAVNKVTDHELIDANQANYIVAHLTNPPSTHIQPWHQNQPASRQSNDTLPSPQLYQSFEISMSYFIFFATHKFQRFGANGKNLK